MDQITISGRSFQNDGIERIHTLPDELMVAIFTYLMPENESDTDLRHISIVCKKWHRISNDDCLWKKHFWLAFLSTTRSIGEYEKKNDKISLLMYKRYSALIEVLSENNYLKHKSSLKNFYEMDKRIWVIWAFPDPLKEALGGEEILKKLPFLILKNRALENFTITTQDIKAPLMIGQIVNNDTTHPFFAMRFITREFGEEDKRLNLNIWFAYENKVSSSWNLLVGDREDAPATNFLNGLDARALDYIKRLCKSEPCGIRDLMSFVEYRKTTNGKSTVFLA